MRYVTLGSVGRTTCEVDCQSLLVPSHPLDGAGRLWTYLTSPNNVRLVTMATVGQTQLKWTGYTGSPGYTTLHASVTDAASAATYLAALKTWVNAALRAWVPSAVTITVLGEVKILNSATGVMEDSYGGAPQSYVGSATGGLGPGPVGGCITWKTNTLNARGHKIRGRTFAVPMAATYFDTDGTLTSAGLTTLSNAAISYLTDVPFPIVWHRPVGGAGGIIAPIVSSAITDQAAVLRSRRN